MISMHALPECPKGVPYEWAPAYEGIFIEKYGTLCGDKLNRKHGDSYDTHKHKKEWYLQKAAFVQRRPL